jgi:alpha-beta hydrolase superfamily lysophospholipase
MVSEINLTPTASYIEIGQGSNGSLAQAGSYLVPARTWGTSNECTAAAVLVHGLGAHSGWFEALGRRLKVRRVFALAYDQVGFGKRRSDHFISQQQWYADLVIAYEYVRNKVGDKPVYILGNSMGAAVALKVIADRLIQPAGLAMFSPGFDGGPKLFTLGYRLSAIISAVTTPEKEVAVPYTPDMITRTQSVRTWLYADPDRRFSPTGKMLLELLKLSIALKKARRINCPLALYRAGIDDIVDGKAAQRIFDRLESPSKKQRIFGEAWHDLMFDPVLDELSDDLCTWISETSKGAEKTRAV